MLQNTSSNPSESPLSTAELEILKHHTTIFIVSSSTQASGGARQAVYLAKTLHQSGFDVRFVAPANSETLALVPELPRVNLPKGLLNINRTLKSLIPAGNNIVVHGFHNWGVKVAAYLCTWWRLQGLPAVGIAHRGVTARAINPIPYLLPGIKAFLVNSRTIKDMLPLFWRKNRCYFVSNSIPSERITPNRDAQAIRRELNIPAEHLIIGSVVAKKPEKGVDRLLMAYAKAKAGLPESTLLVVGVPAETWQPLCEELGISDQVRFVSRTENIADYVQTFALFVFTSYFIESQPNVIMEAMSMGIPVIASNIGEIPYMISEDCLFKPGDPEQAAQKMVEVGNNPQRLTELGELNLAKSAMFSHARRQETILHHYAAALQEIGALSRPDSNAF